MADFDKIDLYGTVYNVKDATSRQVANDAKATATQAKSAAEAAKTAAANAQSAADAAKESAATAQSTASAAKTAAEKAQKDATKALDQAIVISYVTETTTLKIAKANTATGGGA